MLDTHTHTPQLHKYKNSRKCCSSNCMPSVVSLGLLSYFSTSPPLSSSLLRHPPVSFILNLSPALSDSFVSPLFVLEGSEPREVVEGS